MSGEDRRFGGFILPVIVIMAGAYFLLTSAQNGALHAAALKPVNWAGLALMAAGLIATLFRKPIVRLLGVLICGVGAILVICL